LAIKIADPLSPDHEVLHLWKNNDFLQSNFYH